MTTLHPRKPPAFWIGLCVPLAIALMAAWQWQRAGTWPTGLLLGPDLAGGLRPLAALTALLGVTATVASGLAWQAMRQATRRALQSRDALLRGFDGGRRWLPAFMLLQTLLVFGGLIGVLAFEIGRVLMLPHLSGGAMKLAMFAGLLALALAWYGLKILRDTVRFTLRRDDAAPIGIMGRALSPAQAPLLWEFVRDVATRTGASLPDSVVIGLNEGFFVTEHPVVLVDGQRVPDGRVLYLPLPYMAFLDRAQVAAVIAHELGHFAGEDTAYGLRLAPIHRALAGSVLAVTNEHDDQDDGWRAWLSAPASGYGKWFLASFDEAVHHWSRERELAADAFSSRIAGAVPAALALLRSAVLHERVEEALACNRDAPPHQREGVLPVLRRLVAERGLADPRDHLDDRQPHPLDTHPPLRQRLDALGVAITPDLLAHARDARGSSLLAELGLEAA